MGKGTFYMAEMHHGSTEMMGRRVRFTDPDFWTCASAVSRTCLLTEKRPMRGRGGRREGERKGTRVLSTSQGDWRIS